MCMAYCVSVSKLITVHLNLFVFGSCFRTLAVILFQIWFFFSRVNFLCWLLFGYPFHPYVTAVAHKRSRLFCQKCRWQITAKHTYTEASNSDTKLVHGYMVYTELAPRWQQFYVAPSINLTIKTAL